MGLATDAGSLVYYLSDPLSLYIDSPGTQFIDAFPDSPTVANFVISTDVTWEATGIAVCGLIFRSETDVIQGAQYQLLTLRFSGLPGWDIEYHKDGFYQNNIIGEVKFSDAMNLENNATNNILLIAENEKFTVYFNGVRQGSFFDFSKQRLDGIFGLAASEDSGETTCTYANTWVWQLP